MNASLSDFSFYLCPGNMPDPKFIDIYNKIYGCWHEVWSEAFRELGVTKKLNSDAFTRQDLIGATFYKDQCIGMFFLRWTDGSHANFSDDSYFDIWNDQHRADLCSRGNKIIVSSNLTVHPIARGKNLGISGKDLVVGMTVQTFLNSKADGMTGAMRVDRGANKTTARWGSVSIAERVPCEYGENNTELVGFFHDDIRNAPPHEVQDFAQGLWDKRIFIPRWDVQNEFASVASLRPERGAA